MKRIAIVIATKHGQTIKIANRVKTSLLDRGFSVHLYQVKSDEDVSTMSVERFDAVIVGGPVYRGQLPSRLIQWTKTHLQTLNVKPTALFTVSLNAADTKPEARIEDMHQIGNALDRTGLKPRLTVSLIGALNFTQYGFLERWIMKRISASASGPTDTRVDHELTDWIAVDRFAQEFVDVCLLGTTAPAQVYML